MERRGSGLREICLATAAEDAYRPEFKPRFENGYGTFRVILPNMKYEETLKSPTKSGRFLTPLATRSFPGLS